MGQNDERLFKVFTRIRDAVTALPVHSAVPTPLPTLGELIATLRALRGARKPHRLAQHAWTREAEGNQVPQSSNDPPGNRKSKRRAAPPLQEPSIAPLARGTSAHPTETRISLNAPTSEDGGLTRSDFWRRYETGSMPERHIPRKSGACPL